MKVTQMNPFDKPPVRPRPVRYTAPDINPVTPPPAPFPFDIKSFKKDDWILLGIIAVLMLEGCTDYILLCALGYLFYVGL